jgi:SAM-dependent methyltransferase
MRIECQKIINDYALILDLHGARVLDVGIAGDPPPGENYQWFGKSNVYETLDIDSRYDPDHVGDITDAPFTDGQFDLVILSNTLEHVWDFKKAVQECLRVSNSHVIIDCPFFYPYHAEDDFEDYWRLSKTALIRLLEEEGAEIIKSYQTQYLSSVLCKK